MNEEINLICSLSDIELIDYFLKGVKNRATGGEFLHYHYVRSIIIKNKYYEKFLPAWVKICRDDSSFWSFIKEKFNTYHERRVFLDKKFADLFDYLESKSESPIDKIITFDEAHIHFQWEKAIERKENDPEGAITIARTLIEGVLKYILGEKGIEYKKNIELSELYKEVAKSLNMAPEQHQEQIFKQFFGGANGIVSGLGALRNKLGDAHDNTKNSVKPLPRHSELAVNLAGTMAVFLYKTFKETNNNL